MTVVGSAYITVNAITTGFQSQVQNALNGLTGSNGPAGRAGSMFGSAFSGNASKSMSQFAQESLGVYEGINNLIEKSYFLQAGIGMLIPLLGSAAGGIGALGLEAISAAPSVAALAGVMGGLMQGMIAFKIAFGGMGKALGQVFNPQGGAGLAKQMPGLLQNVAQAQNRIVTSTHSVETAQRSLNDAYKNAAERIQQLKFDSEDAVISEKRAAIELEKARETLARVQDLAPNNRARREAELAFAQADLNLRRAKDRTSDLNKETAIATKNGTYSAQEEVDNSREVLDAKYALSQATYQQEEAVNQLIIANKKLADAEAGRTAAGASAMANLNQYQKEFVAFMKTLKPEFDDLRTQVSKAMLPPLEDAIRVINDRLFPTIKEGFVGAGAAIGSSAKAFADIITSNQAVSDLGEIFKINNKTLEAAGPIFGRVVRIIERLYVAAGPLIDRFVTFIDTISKDWVSKLDKDISGVQDTFKTAGDIAAGFGKIIGNIIGAFKNMAKAVTGPGGAGTGMLDWLIGLSEKFESFTQRHLADGKLQKYFQGASKGFMGMLGLIGKIVEAVLRFGADASLDGIIGSIGKGIDAIIAVLPQIVETGGKFAEFIGLLLEHFAQFADSGSVNNFFNVINAFADIVLKIMSNPIADQIFIALAAMHGFRLGVGRVVDTLDGFTKYLAGDFFNTAKLIDSAETFALQMMYVNDAVVNLIPQLGFLQTALQGTALEFMAPYAAVLLIVAVIAAAVAIFYEMWKNSEVLRNALHDLADTVMGALGEAWDKINKAIADAIPGISGVNDLFKWLGDFVGTWLVPILSIYLKGAIEEVADVISGWIKIIGGIIDMFKFWWEIVQVIFSLFKGDISGVKEHFGKAFEAMISGLKKIFGGVFQILTAPFKEAFNFVARIWNATLGKMSFTVPSWVPGFGGKKWGIPSIPLWGETDALGASLGGAGSTSAGFKMAVGGTVMPSPGGTLVRVAEAGRAERIEPLDKDGLSKRDKAIMSKMGIGGGVTINVHPAPGMDERELASLVSRQLAVQLSRGMA